MAPNSRAGGGGQEELAAALAGAHVHARPRTSTFCVTRGRLVRRTLTRPPQYNIMDAAESPSLALASSSPSTGRRLAAPAAALPPPAEPHTAPLSSTPAHSWAFPSADPASAFDNTHQSPTSTTKAPPLPTYHVRAPSTALKLDIDTNPFAATTPAHTSNQSSTVEGNALEALRQSATAPTAIHEGRLRSAWSTASLGSLSPGSALSSPALNALGDITPLPSPLVMSDSPGPWQRAAQPPRPRGVSGSRDDSFFPYLHKGNLSPSPPRKKQSYQKLKTAMADAASAPTAHAQQSGDAARERNRSLSEYTPETLPNVRPRHVTIGYTTAETDANMQQHLHREQYLAAQRGLVPAKLPAGLPTPPASNASNRSVTDTEEEDVTEDDKTRYIVVRHGPQKTKKLWRPVRQLGQGTFSKVYLATCEKTTAKDPLDESSLDPRQLVAIKVCEHGPAGGADEQRVELSLKREVEMLRSISHPSLIHLQAFDHNDAQALIVLTYCPGGDLFDAASAHRDTLTASIVQRIFAEMVSAVRYLHTQFIVHRDIKLESTVPCSAALSFGVEHIFVWKSTNVLQMSFLMFRSRPSLFSRARRNIRRLW